LFFTTTLVLAKIFLNYAVLPERKSIAIVCLQEAIIVLTMYIRGVILAVRGPNPVRHAPFCGLRYVSFVLALGLTELLLLLCHSRITFFVYSHTRHYP